MLAPPPTQQQLAAAAGHACSRPSPARNVDPAGPHPPAALQAAAGSGRRRRAEQDKRKPPRRTCSSAEIDHPLRVAAVNWRPAAAPAAAAFALLPALFGSGGHGESSRGWPASWLPITSSRPARSSMDRLGLLRIGSSFEFDHIMETKP